MTDDQKIQLAADLIYDDPGCGRPSPAVALYIARRVFEIWQRKEEIRQIPPGEIARRFRDRYEQTQAVVLVSDMQGFHVYSEDNCPGHVASVLDPKICGWCGVHIDSLRPPSDHSAEMGGHWSDHGIIG